MHEKTLSSPLSLLLMALLLLTACGPEDGKFRLEGRLRNMNQGEFWVYSPDGGITGIDTIRVRDSRFRYETHITGEATLVVIFPNYSELPVFARSGATVTMKGDASHLKEIDIDGTDNNALMTRLRKELNKALPPEVPKVAERFIREHPDLRASVYVLQRYFVLSREPDYRKAKQLCTLLLKEQPESGTLIHLEKRLASVQGGRLKSRMPAFKATDLKGRRVSEKDLKGDLGVLSVWASWNFQSTDMQRRLLNLRKDFGQRLKIVSVCIDGRPAICRDRVERDSLPWSTICDGRMWQTPLLATFGMTDVPGNVLIDAAGNIVQRDLQPQELEDEIRKRLQKE